MAGKESSTSLVCGIVGLPNVGKSTLFNALTKKSAAAASNYPFCTIDPNVGIVDLPDKRLEELAKLSHSEKIVPATVTFVDIAGLVKGASQGEGLGNKFLANIRETDLIIHVVRCFEDEEIIHVEGRIHPLEDIETINLELILADLQMIENISQKLEKRAKSTPDLRPQLETLQKIRDHLDQSKPVRSLQLSAMEKENTKEFSFLSAKPVVYLANVAEDDLPEMNNRTVEEVAHFASSEGSQVIPICAKLEEELAALEPFEAAEYLESLGLQEAGLDKLIRTSFAMLGLLTFLTTGKEETRAWTVKKGATAPVAAGRIHSDIQKGFIRAEVISYQDFIECSGRVEAKERAKARFEGKDYIVRDGDVILFYHN